jgi:hypothetical protein|nr:MAG TPA: hypothetical protein [Bacteriophage sp.]
MTGFDWNEFFAVFKANMKKEYPKCTVDRYTTPKQSQFPYCDVALGDNSGGHYDLEGNEGSQNPLIVISAYATGSLADSECNKISQAAKKVMLSYGFQCKVGPIPVTNATDPNVKRWVGRYQRIFGSGDELMKLN